MKRIWVMISILLITLLYSFNIVKAEEAVSDDVINNDIEEKADDNKEIVTDNKKSEQNENITTNNEISNNENKEDVGPTLKKSRANGESGLAEGTYYIVSALNESKLIEAADGKMVSGINVRLNEKRNLEHQKWTVRKIDGDYYEISLYNSNVSLDVQGAGKKNGANVWNYSRNNSVAQSWMLKKTEDGYYYIISKCNSLYLDVAGGSTKNGTNINMYQANYSNAQKFKFIEVVEDIHPLEDGDYIIETALRENRVLDIAGGKEASGTNVQLYQSNFSWAQAWNVKYNENGYYTITTLLSSHNSLDVFAGNMVDGQNVQTWALNNSLAQRWIIKESGDGYYYILSGDSKKYLDIRAGDGSNGANIQIFSGNGSAAQKFKFIKYDSVNLEDGLYTINSSISNNKVISLSNDVAYNNTNVELLENKNENKQKWYINNCGNGAYVISSAVDKGKYLSVSSGNVIVSNSKQKWYLLTDGNSVSLMSSVTGKALDIYAANIEDHTNIHVYSPNDSNAQKFKINKTDINIVQKTYDDGYYMISSVNDNKVLDVYSGRKENGTNIQLFEKNLSTAQVWKLQYSNDGYYTITSSMNPMLSLNLANESMSVGSNIDVSKFNGSDGQKWLIKVYGDGYVSIISKKNGLYMDVYGGNLSDGSNVQMWSDNGSNAQKFKLIKYDKRKVYTGIDVSSHQNEINWKEVSNYGMGFAIIRIGYGANYDDQDDVRFLYNVEQVEKYNIPYAVYLYSYASEAGGYNSADEEANHTLRLLRTMEERGYTPTLGKKVFYDIEDPSVAAAGKGKLTDVAKTFCNKIEQNGYKCGIYASTSWFNNLLDSVDLFSKYVLWLADWTVNVDSFASLGNKQPSYTLTPYKFWQFCSDGHVPGINGYVDLNIGYDIFD